MEKELKVRDIEHMQIAEMVELAQLKIVNTLLLLETAIYIAEPQNPDAEQSISMLSDFNEFLIPAYEKVMPSMDEISRPPERRGK